MAIFKDDVQKDGNPYVRTLEEAILEQHQDIQFVSNKDLFWKENDWDIIHIMWPDAFAPYLRNGYDLRKRLRELKMRGTKIITTIHNLTTHYENIYKKKAYEIVYPEADIMIHLGAYSKGLMESQYPNINHVIIPHHVYDTCYSQSLPSHTEALKYFNYKDGLYSLSFGAIRNKEEMNLITKVVSNCPNIKFVVPRFVEIPHDKYTKRWVKQYIKKLYYQLKYPNLIISGKTFVSDNELPLYYALADISFIPRTDTLNSGNVPLGMYMGHVVVGPNVGNVGDILKESGNFCFDPNDTTSVLLAMHNAIEAIKHQKGQENKNYALTHWNTKCIAEELWKIYVFSSK